MGQPSTTVYQQPTKAEIDANKVSNQQKTAALAKINQAIYGESKGLRGMGGLYEWAGPTPFLAGPMGAQTPKTPAGQDPNVTGPYGVPYNQPGGAGAWTTGPGIVPTPPGETPGWQTSKQTGGAAGYGPMVYGTGKGPYGDRGPPGWQPAPGGGGRNEEKAPTPATASPYQQSVLTKLDAAAGLPAPTFKAPPNVPPTQAQYSQKQAVATGLVSQINKPAVIPAPPQNPAIYAQQAAKKAGLPVQGPAAVTPKVTYTSGSTVTQGTLPTGPSTSTIPTTGGSQPMTAASQQPAPAAAAAPAPVVAKTTPTNKLLTTVTTSRPSLYQTMSRVVNTGGGQR